MTELNGTRVLVVGGSSGIGLAVAEAAAQAGAAVTIASRSRQKLDAATRLIGPAVATIEVDVGSDASVAAAFGGAIPWDHIAVTAGEVRTGPIRKLAAAAAIDGVNGKLWGAYRVAAAAPLTSGGSLTFVSGAFSVRPAAGRVQASIANAGLEALARGLALELAPTRVNAVSPGLIDTPLWAGLPDDRREAMFEASAAALPARRIGEPRDVAAAVIGCMTNGFMTGSVLLIDGGHTLI